MKKLIMTKKDDSSNIRYEYDSNNKLNKIIFNHSIGCTGMLCIENDTVIYQHDLDVRFVFDEYGNPIKKILEDQYYGEYSEYSYVMNKNIVIGLIIEDGDGHIIYRDLSICEAQDINHAIEMYRTYGGNKLAKQILLKKE